MKCLLAALLLYTRVAIGAEINVSWTPPELNTDGSPADISGYTVHYGESPRNYTQTQEISTPAQTSTVLTVPDNTEWYIAVTATSTDGHQSAFSNEVFRQAGETPPGAAIADITWTFTGSSMAYLAASGNSGGDLGGGGPYDGSIVVPANADLMVAAYGYWRSGDGADATWTFDPGGANEAGMTIIAEQDDTELSGDGGVWHITTAYLQNPPQGTFTVRVAPPGSGVLYSGAMVAGFWDSVDSTTPILDSAAGYDTSASLVTVTSSTINSEATADHMAIFACSGLNPDFGLTGQTQRREEVGSGSGIVYCGFGTLNSPAAGTDNMQVSLADGAWVVLSVNVAGGGGGGAAIFLPVFPDIQNTLARM